MMRLHNLGLSAFVCLLVVFSNSWVPNLSMVFTASQVLAQTVNQRKTEADRLHEKGIQEFQTSNYRAALKSWQQALNIYREIKDRKGEGKALGNLGVAFLDLEDYSEAIKKLEQSLAITQEIKYRQGEANALRNLGEVYRILGEYPQAIKKLRQSLVIAREIKDIQSQASLLGNLGVVYGSQGNYPKAIEYQQQWLAIAREFKDRLGEASSLGNLGLAFYFLGDYQQAIDYQKQSLAIAQEIKDRQLEANALASLGSAYYGLGDYPQAIDYQKQSLAIERKIKDRLGESKTLNNLGNTLYKQGNMLLAESTLFEGINVLESLRSNELKDSEKVSIFETQRSTYRILQKVLIAQNKNDAGLEIAERGRARAFVALLASRLFANAKEKFPTPPTIAEIKQIAKSQNATLVQYSIITDDFKIAGKLQTKESELYIWVIKPTGEVTFRKLDLKPLWQQQNTSLKTVVESIQQTSPVEWNKPLKQLHQILIKPIASELPKDPNARVIFIPQQSLFRVPFPALQDDKGKYLIEQHTILTAPSIQVLQLTREQRKLASGKGFLIVGNPIMPKIGDPPTQLPPLPEAEKEAIEIADLYKTKAIIGKDATKVNILQQISKARIIHLATHGQLDDNYALGSWIALAPSGKDNGLLTAAEIFDFKFKLKAELLVLSACEAGRGRVTGDGVIGLSRSLIYAGVPSVIVSLWTVPDDSSKLLMTEFYKNLQRNPDKAQALRQAMLKTSKQYAQPVEWAAFTLIGEAE
jgi:CHAT domain-containing protein